MRACLSRRTFALSARGQTVKRCSTCRHFSSYLVSPAQLQATLNTNDLSGSPNSPKTIPLCATWFLPTSPFNGLQTFREKRLPAARFFDLDKISDKDSVYPHMLPSSSDFAKAMSALGISKKDTVVVYDSLDGIFSAPRVAWMLKVFGHRSVHVLNNFKIWVEQGLPTESGEFWDVDTCVYPIPKMDTSRWLIEYDELKHIVENNGIQAGEKVQILDARSHGRWMGKDPEPRAGISSGHIPGSINIPYSELLDPVTKAILPGAKLREIFRQKGIYLQKPIISSCGTGVTAAVIEAALLEAGCGSEVIIRIYDGSWTEWASRESETDGLIAKEN